MKVLFHNVYSSLNDNNNLFQIENSSIGDNLLSPFHRLEKLSTERGIELGTKSKISVEECNAIVFVDYPRKDDPIFQYALKNDVKSYLITLESPIIRPEVFKVGLHEVFERVFTWSDKLVDYDHNKYIKINYSYDIRSDFNFTPRNKNYVIIAGNKKNACDGELYTERLKCINWFDGNDPSNLDLFGFDWDLKPFDTTNLWGTLLNNFNRKFRLFKRNYRSYRGVINRKYEILPEYKFCICFENVAGYDGYITEKIFDCFFSGTIPIYKGAPNIEKYIPKSCFINYDDYSNISEMNKSLKSMSPEAILNYQHNIMEFLLSKKVDQFRTEIFASTILDVLSEKV